MRVDIMFTDQVPTVKQMTADKRSIELSWTFQQSNSTCPITGFVIRAGSKDVDVTSSERQYTLTGLTPYTEYHVKMLAKTQRGNGLWSEAKTIKTKTAAPSAPVNVNGTLISAHDSVRPRAIITWDKPRNPNGIISEYTIVYFYNNVTSNKKTVTIRSRSGDLTYIINVTKNGMLSYKISATTNEEGPYAAGNDIFYGCPEQSLVGKEGNLNIPDSSYTALSYYKSLGNPNDDRHVPHNAKLFGKYGWAPRDNKNAADYLQIDLGTPRVITAVATQGSGINNEWLKSYNIQLANNNLSRLPYRELFKGNTDSTNVVRHELENPQLARYIRFVPLEYHDWKTMRVNVYVTDQEPPCLTPIPNKRSIRLTWTYRKCSPTDRIIGYLMKVGNSTHRIKGDIKNYTVINLEPYTEYNVSIKVIRQVGYGVWSNVTTIRTVIAEPEAIASLNATVKSSDTILLNFKLQKSELIHGPLKGYRLTYTPQGGKTKTIDVGDVTTYTLTSLLSYKNYTITVAVSNTEYTGPPSTKRRVRTMEDAPSAPVNVTGTLLPAQGGSLKPRVNITWDKPRYPNGIIRKYTIVYFYNMDTSNKKTVIIDRTSNLRYIIKITGNGTLSYKLSATTIKEGPYQSGENITIPPHAKSRRNAETTPFSLNRMMIAGFVTGFIVLLVILIVVTISRKRRYRNRKRKNEQVMMDPVPQSAQLAVFEDAPALAPAPEENYYNNILDISAKRSLVAGDNNVEDIAYEETEVPIPDLKPIQSSIEFIPPDKNILTEEFKSTPVEPRHESKMAKRPANKIKNRYKNIVAYDHSLVALGQDDNNSDSCYINASFIRAYDGTPSAYIATQGPLNNTLDDFWRMIWDHEISSIIMLTNLLELGKRKCHQYWPDNNSARYSDITVTNHKSEVFADFTIRTFFLSKADMPKRKVLHFHFTAWPDKGVPEHATAALAFRRKVLALSSDVNRPMVIHCSAGVGRTGTYIMIDALLRQAQTDQQTLDLAGYLNAIRDDRPYMVQTLEQYIFVSMAIHEALTCGNTEIQAHNLRIVIKRLSTVDKRLKLTGYALEFQRLEAVTSQNTNECFDVGMTKKNMKKNRYSNIVATNQSRVILSTDEAENQADYVNASTIDVEDGGKEDYINASFAHTYRERNAFIMTQAPMENTIADFWRMVVDYEIGTIVMLNNLEEECESFPQYWPKHGTKKFGDVTVKLVETKDMDRIIIRQFQVTKQGTRRIVCHLQTLTWENKCIPADTQTVLNLLDEVQKSQQKSGNSPIVVQCSNGVGRSGTFCAIASCLERVKQEQVLDVFQTVKSIRVNRPGAVETLTQYVFCYNIFQKYLDSFSDYANFGDVN